MKDVLIIDYGMGNLASVSRALEKSGFDPVISDSPSDLNQAEKILLPGVGAFRDAMDRLKENKWLDALDDAVYERNKPLLGICLGMQLLADKGFEGGKSPGLGFIPGSVEQLEPRTDERIPHMGWNDVVPEDDNFLFDDIDSRTDFYFAHSFHFQAESTDNVVATCDYCGGFSVAVQSPPVYGVQFHPEKSSKAGQQLLENFMRSA